MGRGKGRSINSNQSAAQKRNFVATTSFNLTEEQKNELLEVIRNSKYTLAEQQAHDSSGRAILNEMNMILAKEESKIIDSLSLNPILNNQEIFEKASKEISSDFLEEFHKLREKYLLDNPLVITPSKAHEIENSFEQEFTKGDSHLATKVIDNESNQTVLSVMGRKEDFLEGLPETYEGLPVEAHKTLFR